MTKRFVALFLLSLAALSLTAAVRGTQQQEECPHRPVSPGDALGYERRGPVCEGRAARYLSGTTYLTPQSLTRGRLPRGAIGAAKLVWEGGLAGQPMRLDAVSLGRSEPYRFHHRLDADQGEFEWSFDVGRALDVRFDSLGVTATQRRPSDSETVYQLLSVVPAGAAAARSDSALVWLRVGSEPVARITYELLDPLTGRNLQEQTRASGTVIAYGLVPIAFPIPPVDSFVLNVQGHRRGGPRTLAMLIAVR